MVHAQNITQYGARWPESVRWSSVGICAIGEGALCVINREKISSHIAQNARPIVIDVSYGIPQPQCMFEMVDQFRA
jgi:hypothetical protein